MTTAELKRIDSALGAGTVNALAEVANTPDKEAGTGLAVAVTMAVFQELRLSLEIAALAMGRVRIQGWVGGLSRNGAAGPSSGRRITPVRQNWRRDYWP